MATFEFAGSNSRNEVPQEKYPLRRVEPSLRKFVKVLQIDLQRLQQHRTNIEKAGLLGNWEALNREQINASRTVQQLKANVKQLERTRMQVCEDDLAAFDDRVQDIRDQAISGVLEFLNVHGQDSELPLEDVAETNDSNALSSSAPSGQMTLSFAATRSAQHSQDSSSPVSPGMEQSLPFPLQQQLILRDSPDEQSQQSWEELREGLVELNGIIHDFSTLVQSQQEKVDNIEDNIENAQANVHEGTVQLTKAYKLKSAMFPVAGALLGGVMGGPVGLVAGLKLGGLAAVGGGIIGLTGGTLWKRRQDRITEVDLTNLKKSHSLPDLTQSDSQDVEILDSKPS